MEYKVAKLAEEYASALSNLQFERLPHPSPTFNLNSYNDYEYISCLNQVTKQFNQFDDLNLTEKFLKGE